MHSTVLFLLVLIASSNGIIIHAPYQVSTFVIKKLLSKLTSLQSSYSSGKKYSFDIDFNKNISFRFNFFLREDF